MLLVFVGVGISYTRDLSYTDRLKSSMFSVGRTFGTNAADVGRMFGLNDTRN